MASWNWSLEFGEFGKFGEAGDPQGFGPVEVEHRVFCDAHMMPHEWLELGDGRLLKLDGAAHGDDHFFPGPCDIAWDLAGTIVEWKLTGPEAEYFSWIRADYFCKYLLGDFDQSVDMWELNRDKPQAEPAAPPAAGRGTQQGGRGGRGGRGGE